VRKLYEKLCEEACEVLSDRGKTKAFLSDYLRTLRAHLRLCEWRGEEG
jgi:predicted house-cleaning noncanonical NTP pyrophosphatase (MazG superfamily)